MGTITLAQWWEPHAPERKLAGTLFEAEPGILHLTLNGHFGPNETATLVPGVPMPVTPPFNDFPILLGTTSQGKHLTLIDCVVRRASGIPNLTQTSQEVRPRLIAHDVHFLSADEVRFTSLSIRYSNLDEWVAKHGFQIQITDTQPYSVSVTYTKPENIRAQLPTGLNVDLGFSMNGPSLSANRSDLHMEQQTWISATAPDDRSHEELLGVISMVADLISLGVGAPLRRIECQATALESDDLAVTPNQRRFPLHDNSTPVAPIQRPVDTHDMLFLLEDLKPRFGTILQAWCARQDEIQPLYSLYFGTLRSPSMYVEHRFLNMFQALEAYARRAFPPSEEELERHGQRLNRILSSVGDSKDKKWLEGKLRYSHEPTSSDRLRRLVQHYGAEWVFDDATKDIELAGDLRNYHTHFDPKLAHRIPPATTRPRMMHNLFVRLQILCELILLQLLGFDRDESRRRMETTRRLQRRLVK